MKPRPCGCKGCRTCLICENQYGAAGLKLSLDKNKSYVYCPLCAKAWSGWDTNLYKEHPNHEGHSIEFPGVFILLDFITQEEENDLMTCIDEVPWDTSQSGRRKQNYGPKTNFKKKKLVLGKFDGFPQFSKYIQDRFNCVDLLEGYEVIEQCSLEYDPNKGASIDPHIDDCWVWGERIVTVNCLSDTALTMTPYKGDQSKYNLACAKEYPPTVLADGRIDLNYKSNEPSIFETSKPKEDRDVIVRIPMIRRSLAVLYGEPRYHWEHCVLREDIPERRVCIAYREFTPTYMANSSIGDEIRSQAKHFWDHTNKNNV
ncbi:unnamed protein product [Leptidea sinapis]|uniref:Isopenicillin N synthase-like Fe(2+) 2OG dioxygenase domain-containing protein n=1 Tax=Leptidea sinapis TaxID=189913 RepID=A0A5E4QE59_9NEOP|nr:unnamed protein product [Leptidea sinapis]